MNQITEIEASIERLLNSKMHGRALRSAIEKIFEIYGINEFKIIRTKRGYLVYFRLPEGVRA